ncbi:MAG: fluoride efflux transporter CrcB [Chitinophagales bacterium]|nr:fluoride efflux transporter CrcB [Chitinophagales bacterium]
MQLILLVGTGSFIGGVARFLLSQLLQSKISQPFPVGTLVVNIIGCLVIGSVFGLGEKTHISAEWRLFIMTGVCGGFTTFSAFGLETISLLRDGQHVYALTYIVASILLGLLATFGGMLLFK